MSVSVGPTLRGPTRAVTALTPKRRPYLPSRGRGPLGRRVYPTSPRVLTEDTNARRPPTPLRRRLQRPACRGATCGRRRRRRATPVGPRPSFLCVYPVTRNLSSRRPLKGQVM